MFHAGASKPTFDQLQHHGGNLQSFGMMRSQVVDCENLHSGNVTADTSTITDLTVTGTLLVTGTVTLPGVTTTQLTVTTTNATPTTPATVATLAADGDVRMGDAVFTASRTDASPLGSEAVTFKLENYQLRRESGTGAVVADGFDAKNDPTGRGYAVSVTASGNDIQISVTGAAAETVDWVIVFRYWG